jgi:hypothetical protein
MDKAMIDNYTNFTVNRIGGVNAFTGDTETTLTEEEVNEIIGQGVEIAPYVEPVPTIGDIRAERDQLLAKYVDIYNPMRWSELTATQKEVVKTYRKALLDITQQDPSSVTWPEPPLI